MDLYIYKGEMFFVGVGKLIMGSPLIRMGVLVPGSRCAP